MLATLLLLTQLGVNDASAQALTVAPSAVLLGSGSLGLRPGLRLGYEPIPALALEVVGDYSSLGFDAGAALTGRAWLVGEETGIFLLGRGNIGMAGFDGGRYGVWSGLYGGFGGRPASWLNLEVSTGPDWVFAQRFRWRTEATVGFVFELGGDSGTVRHRPTRKVR
jgi:hypothetical protein